MKDPKPFDIYISDRDSIIIHSGVDKALWVVTDDNLRTKTDSVIDFGLTETRIIGRNVINWNYAGNLRDLLLDIGKDYIKD